MSQNLPLGGFKWFEETCQFNADFIKIYNEDSDIGYVIEAVVQCPEELYELDNNSPFLLEKIKIGKVKNLHPPCMIKKNTLYI